MTVDHKVDSSLMESFLFEQLMELNPPIGTENKLRQHALVVNSSNSSSYR